MLVLEDGRTFEGVGFGAAGETSGEVVFNTAMTGYQEILTDPSYKGQIVTMTYPLIGNYGVNSVDVESDRIYAEGFVIRELSSIVSNYRAEMSLDKYLKANNVVGVAGVDTRALTRHIRLAGAMRGVISTTDLDADSLRKKALSIPEMTGLDLVKEVTIPKPAEWKEGLFCELELDELPIPQPRYRVAVVDYGIKRNISRLLVQYGFEVTTVPADYTAKDIAALDPQCIFLSNGPGDPLAVTYAIETIRRLVEKYPTFGICLGHQLMGLAFGGERFKLKFGHHGANHPVQDLDTRKVAITSQNHGFAIDPDSLDGTGAEVMEINLNDNTVEGLRHTKYPAFSVQYHPEASPGPHDSRHLFARFRKLVAESL